MLLMQMTRAVPQQALPHSAPFNRAPPQLSQISEALARLEEVLCRLSDFGLQLKAKKCTFMQTEVAFLGHIVARTSLACDTENISAVRNWHAPGSVKQVRQFVDFIGYYRRFIQDFTGLSEPLWH